MPVRRLSRLVIRSLSGALAVSLGVALFAVPQQGKPHVGGEDHVLSARRVAAGFTTRTPLETGAEMVGFTWAGQPDAGISTRGRLADGTWTSWVDLSGQQDDGPDEGSAEHRSRSGAGPAWLAHDVVEIETRLDSGSVADLRLHAIDTEAAESSGSPFAPPAAQAAPGSPLVVTRAQWGADESWRDLGNPGCDGQPHYAASGVRFAVVHHTAGTNSYGPADVPSILRGIYYFHTHDRAWCDVAYNFFIDRFGRGFEGRYGGIDKAVIGGHTGGFNTGSTGVSMVGDFDTSTVPGPAYSALRSLLSWKLAYHGVDPQGSTLVYAGDSPSSRYPPGTPVVVSNIEGHRDTNLTGCPGRYLYALLPQLRRDVAADLAAMADQRMSCDWDGDGAATPGYFFRGVFYLRSSNAAEASTTAFGFGNPTDRAVCGDWDGDGTETAGVVRDGVWYLRQANSTGPAQAAFRYGDPGDVPVVGDWDGNGSDTPGVFRSGRWYLANRLGAVAHDVYIGYGDPGDVPVVGNWDGVGADGVGVFRRGVWYLANQLQTGGAQIAPFGYGDATDTPVAGDWDKDRDDSPGVSRGSIWYLANQTPATSSAVTYGF